MIDLDANATTRPHPAVVEAMLPFLTDRWHNPSSAHRAARRVRAALDEARGQVAALIGADAGEIVFTGCGTESNNAALASLARLAGPAGRVVTSAIEHPAVLQPCAALEEAGHAVTRCAVDAGGRLDPRGGQQRRHDLQRGQKFVGHPAGGHLAGPADGGAEEFEVVGVGVLFGLGEALDVFFELIAGVAGEAIFEVVADGVLVGVEPGVELLLETGVMGGGGGVNELLSLLLDVVEEEVAEIVDGEDFGGACGFGAGGRGREEEDGSKNQRKMGADRFHVEPPGCGD